MKQVEERYFRILCQVAFTEDAAAAEVHLADAFELGRTLVNRQVPPDEVTHIHHEAMVRLSLAHPSLPFARVADRLTLPLMEMNMAYGMAFREQMERRYQEMVNVRLEQSHKLEAVGTLAAGIAHDFNNLLGSIAGFAELAGDELPNGSPGKQHIRQILTAGLRARDLVARMLAFARQGPAVPVAVEVVSQVQEALALLEGAYQRNMDIRFQAGIEQATVMADPGQLQQIVMNLCINAADAMDQRGEVVVRVDSAALENGSAAVCLTVADNGHGMPPEVCERIFDPFYTTKAPGKGSGLGLSVVYGIVTQLGGVIEVRSRAAGDSRGTEFRVVVPVVES